MSMLGFPAKQHFIGPGFGDAERENRPQKGKEMNAEEAAGTTGEVAVDRRRFIGIYGMFHDPFFHAEAEPDAVNAQRENRKEKPQQIAADQLMTAAGKAKAAAVNDRVLRFQRWSRQTSRDTQCPG